MATLCLEDERGQEVSRGQAKEERLTLQLLAMFSELRNRNIADVENRWPEGETIQVWFGMSSWLPWHWWKATPSMFLRTKIHPRAPVTFQRNVGVPFWLVEKAVYSG